MSRPLLAVTSDEELRAELAHISGPLYRAPSLLTLPDLFDEVVFERGTFPLVAIGQDITEDYAGPMLTFDSVLLFTHAAAIDWTGVASIAPAQIIQLPEEWPVLASLLNPPKRAVR
jgi:hypothetical protein